MDPIYVSLRNWLLTGRFGPLRFGTPRAEVRELLGPPTDESIRRGAVSKYGDVELHFSVGDELRLIHMDDFRVPESGGALSLDPWIVRGGMARAELERGLAKGGIAYRLVAPRDRGSSLLVTDSGVELTFVERQESYSPPAGLFAVSRSAPQSSGR